MDRVRSKAVAIDDPDALPGGFDQRRPDGTRKLVLDVAARHFAEHDYSGTSLRAIQREVGVNPATVHYHFGSKDALYRAVIVRSLDLIQHQRLDRLKKVPANLVGRARLEGILLAYLSPHLEHATTPSGYSYARILALVHAHVRDAANDIFDAAVAPVRAEFVAALRPVFPDATLQRISDVLAMAVSNMAMVPIGLSDKSLNAERMARATADCVAYTAAGFEQLCGPIAG